MNNHNEEARQLNAFVGARIKETVEQIEDPKTRRKAWQQWCYDTREACDWVDVGPFGKPRYTPGIIQDLAEMRTRRTSTTAQPGATAETQVRRRRRRWRRCFVTPQTPGPPTPTPAAANNADDAD